MIGKRNGHTTSPVSLADQLAQIEAEITRTEVAGLPLADRLTQAEDELERCEQHYRMYGFGGWGIRPEEIAYYRFIATQGALMVIGRDALLEAEQQRIIRQFEAAGSFGLSPAEKIERLSQPQLRQHCFLAQHELQLRGQEKDGDLIADAKRGGEMFLMSDADLQTIIEQKEAA